MIKGPTRTVIATIYRAPLEVKQVITESMAGSA
jgi:hypothetical protein